MAAPRWHAGNGIGKGEYRFTHTFEPVEGGSGTKLRLVGTIEGMGCMGAVFGVLFKRMFVKAIRKDLDALKAYVEATP